MVIFHKKKNLNESGTDVSIRFTFFVLLKQMLQETEKPWNKSEHWYQMG